MPRPVRKRRAISMCALVDIAVRTVKAPNRAALTIRIHLRPIRSESGPPIAAPIIRPKVLMLRNRPLSPGLMWNSGPRIGRVRPGACRSIPSMMATRQQSPTVRIARPLDTVASSVAGIPPRLPAALAVYRQPGAIEGQSASTPRTPLAWNGR